MSSPLPNTPPLTFPSSQQGDSDSTAVAWANQLVKIYGSGNNQVEALKGVTVSFARGSFTSIMGPSGSGKSTLMHCLAGLDRFTAGQVVLAGTELSMLPERALTELRRDKVGFIFQSFNLLPTMDAKSNILLPLQLAGRKPDQELFDQLVTSLKLTDRLTHLPSELSGGQQQRVAIARALITRPEVVFADEPTGALDSKASASLLEYLRHCANALGQTIIMVTHDPRAAARTDRALILVDGRIVNDVKAPTVEVLNQVMGEVD